MSSVLVPCLLFCLAFVIYSNAQGQYRRVCYYTNWAQYRPKEGKYYPEDMDPNLCSHIIYAFAKLNGNRLVAFEWNDDSTDWMRGMFARFNDIKTKNPSIKTLLAVGGWNMASKPFTAMVATAASRREFATTTVTFLRERNFDGVDIDWEYPANRGSPPEDRIRFTQLVAEVRRAFNEEAIRTGQEALLLTSAVAAGKDKIDTAYDIPEICRDMDFISLMAYDLHGSWENITGHNSPLYKYKEEKGDQMFLNMDWASNYWVQKGCPKHKMVIGMGMYGRSFTLKDQRQNGLMAPVKGKGETGKFTREGGFLAYYEICQMISQGGKSYFIEDQESPYVVHGDQWVGYDDVDSLRTKVKWMKRNGFSGVMVWALDLDDFKGTSCGQGKYPLMNAINKELNGMYSTPVQRRQNRVQPTQQEISEINRNIKLKGPVTPNPNVPHLTDEFKCAPDAKTYFSSPRSCEEYFICSSGKAYKFKCSAPLKWNSQNKFCDWPGNVNCQIKPTPPKVKPVKTKPAPVPKPKPAPRPTQYVRPNPVAQPRPFITPTQKQTPQHQQPYKPPSRPVVAQPIRKPIAPKPKPVAPTKASTEATPAWANWSVWIQEFWKALTSMPVPAGGAPNWLQQAAPPKQAQAPPKVRKTFCEGRPNKAYADPTSCDKFIDCFDGAEYRSQCGTGTYFDTTIGMCNHKASVTRCNVK